MSDPNDIRVKIATTFLACACALSSPVAAEPTEAEAAQSALAAELAILDGEMQTVMAEMEGLQLEADDLTNRILLKFAEMKALLERAEIVTGLIAEQERPGAPLETHPESGVLQ